MSSEAFVTLATNDGYALGALVLAESIRQVGTKRNLVVLISNHLSDLIRFEISIENVQGEWGVFQENVREKFR